MTDEKASTYRGRLILPPYQYALFGAWFSHPSIPPAESVDPNFPEEHHMLEYSSLPPIDLQRRGAELWREVRGRVKEAWLKKIVEEDPGSAGLLKKDPLEFVRGPTMDPWTGATEFEGLSNEELWKHTVYCCMQLVTRYPAFEKGENAIINLEREGSMKEEEIERHLMFHFESAKEFLDRYKGIARSAVEEYRETDEKSKKQLLHSCDDACRLKEALEEYDRTKHRCVAYEPSISVRRNRSIQEGFWHSHPWDILHHRVSLNVLRLEYHYPQLAVASSLPIIEHKTLGRTTSGY